MQNIKTILLSALLLCGSASAEQLNVLTYGSFHSDWGPGGKIATAFAEKCKCEVNWLSAEDSVMMLRRLQLEGDKLEADLIVGLDNHSIGEALASGHVADLKNPLQTNLGESKNAVPFDYGYLAFIKRKDKKLPEFKSLEDFAQSPEKFTVAIQDPRSSSVGASFLAWTNVAGKDSKKLWQDLESKIKFMMPGWSEAYGLFTKGEVDVVLSYTTSPLYHLLAEKDDSYEALIFAEPHYRQTEYAIALKQAKNPELAEEFLAFLLTPEMQKEIALANWMYPVVDGVDLPAEFQNAIRPEGVAFSVEENSTLMPKWLKDWKNNYLKN